jgi:hypothetical protein
VRARARSQRIFVAKRRTLSLSTVTRRSVSVV